MNEAQEIAHLREEVAKLDELQKVSIAMAAELDLERGVQMVTDVATRLTGAAFGSFFYNVVNEKGEAYTLYTISGVPREAFSKFPMPRNTAVFEPTFRGDATVRSDDITKDPRYGKNDPHFGMPKGHLPVRSYLATSVRSQNGEVLGGLFFGHSKPGVFTERSERIVEVIAVQAGIAMDRAHLYKAAQDEIERRKTVEAALRETEEKLAAKLTEQSAQLHATHARLSVEGGEREQAEGRFRLLVEGVVDYAIYMLDPHGVVTNWNAGAARIKGYDASEIVGSNFSNFYTEEDRATNLPQRALQSAREVGRYEAEGWRVRKDGTRFWASVVIDALHDKNTGELLGFAKITRDSTERREAQLALQRAQEQLAQAQKMEGIGHLTGGVAHDFNNLLTIVQGNIETLQRVVHKPELDVARIRRAADNAMLGAQRATALTQRLLAFARRQPLAPKVIDVASLVAGMSDLLKRSLGEQIEIETVSAGGLWRVHADANQLEVAILNLALNARDAMPQGGHLTIETANAYLDEKYASGQVEVIPGQYVVVSVSDTGIGMSKETIARCFEPFFTTKDVGHGTGLGLSQVYGFIKQSGGNVRIYSEVGQGTTVKIYLPRLHSAVSDMGLAERVEHAVGSESGETILVVEDDSDVRRHSTDILSELGYRTLEAGDGQAGLRLLRGHPEIKLLFTDVGLPGGMNGRQMADEARALRPNLKVLFTTGYARNAIVHHGRLDPGVQLITKPFTYTALAGKIRDMLDTQSGPPRVLLVEDEPLIQMTVVDYLEEMGFRAETASTATDALSKLRLSTGEVAAAIVDMGLADKAGDVLVKEMRTLYPHMPIVIASGRGEGELRDLFKTVDRLGIVTKPYLSDALEKALNGLNVRAK